MKDTLTFIAGVVALTMLCVLPIVYVLDKSQKQVDKFKELIGDYYVLESDTLKIVDYSSWKKTYTLSNGLEINQKLVDSTTTFK